MNLPLNSRHGRSLQRRQVVGEGGDSFSRAARDQLSFGRRPENQTACLQSMSFRRTRGNSTYVGLQNVVNDNNII